MIEIIITVCITLLIYRWISKEIIDKLEDHNNNLRELISGIGILIQNNQKSVEKKQTSVVLTPAVGFAGSDEEVEDDRK